MFRLFSKIKSEHLHLQRDLLVHDWRFDRKISILLQMWFWVLNCRQFTSAKNALVRVWCTEHLQRVMAHTLACATAWDTQPPETSALKALLPMVTQGETQLSLLDSSLMWRRFNQTHYLNYKWRQPISAPPKGNRSSARSLPTSVFSTSIRMMLPSANSIKIYWMMRREKLAHWATFIKTKASSKGFHGFTIRLVFSKGAAQTF